MSSSPLYVGYGRWEPWYSWLGLPGRCASLCLQAARGGWAVGGFGQWRKRIRGVYTRRCAIQIDGLYLFTFTFVHPLKLSDLCPIWQIQWHIVLDGGWGPNSQGRVVLEGWTTKLKAALDYLWFTRWQHRSTILPFTKLLQSLVSSRYIMMIASYNHDS